MQYDVTHARLPGLESRGGASRRLPRSLPLPTVLAFSLSLSLFLLTVFYMLYPRAVCLLVHFDRRSSTSRARPSI